LALRVKTVAWPSAGCFWGAAFKLLGGRYHYRGSQAHPLSH